MKKPQVQRMSCFLLGSGSPKIILSCQPSPESVTGRTSLRCGQHSRFDLALDLSPSWAEAESYSGKGVCVRVCAHVRTCVSVLASFLCSNALLTPSVPLFYYQIISDSHQRQHKGRKEKRSCLIR